MFGEFPSGRPALPWRLFPLLVSLSHWMIQTSPARRPPHPSRGTRPSLSAWGSTLPLSCAPSCARTPCLPSCTFSLLLSPALSLTSPMALLPFCHVLRDLLSYAASTAKVRGLVTPRWHLRRTRGPKQKQPATPECLTCLNNGFNSRKSLQHFALPGFPSHSFAFTRSKMCSPKDQFESFWWNHIFCLAQTKILIE